MNSPSAINAMERKIPVNTTYEPFSREPEYIQGNREFIRELPIRPGRRVLDVACGTGAVTECILEVQPDLDICGIDLSRESLELGQTDFLAAGFALDDTFILNRGNSSIIQVEGSADNLPFADNRAELVVMFHSIHMLPDQDVLLREIFRVMASDAVFAFNSSFYAGSQAPGTDRFYQLWWKFALTHITEKDARLRSQGLPGITRKRGTAVRAKPWPSPAEWAETLGRHHFEVLTVNERTIMMHQSSYETIGAYGEMARLMLSGYPVVEASEALIAGVKPAMEEFGQTEIPRLWLEITCKKKSA
jgi:ubiquinone/menaquinone biosynthesis C-methylase UbiE